MRRRGLFAALLAAPALAVMPSRPVVAEPLPIPKAYIVDDQMIHDALVLLGVLCPGECASRTQLDFCRRIAAETKAPSTHELAMALKPAYPRFNMAQRELKPFAVLPEKIKDMTVSHELLWCLGASNTLYEVYPDGSWQRVTG